MAKHRDDLRRGRDEERPVARAKATQLFDLMEKFAGYGFNKSHAAAYALVAYQTAYFKAHHPSAFMAANLSLVMDDTDKVRELPRRCASRRGSRSCRPTSTRRTTASSPSTRSGSATGLGGVKGTGAAAIEAIVAAREAGGPFRDLFDFCRRIDKRAVNRRAVEALVRAGAFDAIDPRRAALLASVGVALDAAERARGDAPRRCRCSARRRPGRRSRSSRRATGPTPSGCAREGGARLLPVRASVRGYAAGARAAHAHDAREPRAAAGARAGRRHRHADARAGEPARQDGVRHARRRPRLGGDHGLQRDLRRRARAPARRPARDRRGQGRRSA